MRRTLAALTLFAVYGSSSACQIIVQTTLTFADGSADLDRSQIIKLAEWIDHANSQFSRYKDAYVEAGASAKTSVDARQLARKRADTTARALKALLPFDLPVETTSQGYREKRVALDGGSDYATIQINPDFKALNVPDCNPVPIPGVKR
ncbi:hypothetical protein ABID97_003817 [Variovorax sp. OAS795]|uniref:hypothetical protein n=1 Tax=Variovorax sp. OAS795 TaxID=3034231 RepID=UPI003394C35A